MNAKVLELQAKFVWPIVRKVVGVSKRCNRCILSEKHGPLTKGLCAECLAETPGPKGNGSNRSPEVAPEVLGRFHATLSKYLTPRQYHAALLLSGGKDSAYLLHRLKTEYPELKILCLYINNGFSSPLAQPNAEFVAQKMESDLLICHSHVEDFARVIRQAFANLKGRGSYGVVDFADGELIFKVGQKIATEMGIPLVLSGLTWVQVQRIVGSNDFEMVQPGGPHLVFPLAAWRVGEQEIRSVVRDQRLLPPGNDSPLASNSSLILTMSVLDILNNGYCSFEPEFAQLIREGKTDRKNWLHLFELLEFGTKMGFFNYEIQRTLKRLNLSMGEVLGAGR